MSILGTWQCQRLTLALCKLSGSSRGARAFQELFVPDFKKENPQLEFSVVQRPAQHPYLMADYKNRRQRTVGIKNYSPEEILRVAYMLRSTKGKKPSLPLPKHKTPLVQAEGSKEAVRASGSIQGKWFPGLFPPVHTIR